MTSARSLRRQTVSSINSSTLSKALCEGALSELYLTPKPGLVDRRDNGSHPDLSLKIMERSAALLPQYYDELAEACLCGGSLMDYRRAGLAAEKRMFGVCGTNTHRGYIFMSGLALLSSILYDDLRDGISALSIQFFTDALPESNGSKAREACGTGGIIEECLKGFPSVFDAGLPAMKKGGVHAGHLALGGIMAAAEDTTSIHRCGPFGMNVVRNDGLRLKKLIESGEDHSSWLAERNSVYIELNLTMGGCADLLALTYAFNSVGIYC